MPPRVPSGRPSMWRSCASPPGARIGDLRRRQRPIADGAPADLHRRGDVALNERRRHAQRVGDVVEPVARLVGRQQRPRRRRRAPADRGWRSRIRCGSADAGPARPAPPGAAPPCRDALRDRRRTHRARRARDAALPLGGIMPARILRTTFSHVVGVAGRRGRGSGRRAPGRPSSARPLWQVMQYCVRSAADGRRRGRRRLLRLKRRHREHDGPRHGKREEDVCERQLHRWTVLHQLR